MRKSDLTPDAYYDKTRTWRDEKLRFRAILRDSALVEEIKWGKPCYTHEGHVVAILYGMKASCGIGFFKGALLSDPEGILIAPGENSQSARQIRVTSVDEIDRLAPILKTYIAEAIENEKAGRKVDFREKHELVFPEELIRALDEDPGFAEAFHALTPGRQRGYNLFFTGAKQSATRAARIEKHRARIMQGKGMHDR